MRRSLAIVVLGCTLVTGACTPRGLRAASALTRLAVNTIILAHILSHHDAHYHHEHCGHNSRYYQGHWDYHYHGHWEYYDRPTATWYRYD